MSKQKQCIKKKKQVKPFLDLYKNRPFRGLIIGPSAEVSDPLNDNEIHKIRQKKTSIGFYQANGFAAVSPARSRYVAGYFRRFGCSVQRTP